MNLTINQDTFDGKWSQLRGTIKQRWGELTEDDLTKVQGRYEQFLGLLQQKYGYSRQTAVNEVRTRLGDLSALTNNLQATAKETVTAVDESVARRHWSVIFAAWIVGIVVGMWLHNAIKS